MRLSFVYPHIDNSSYDPLDQETDVKLENRNSWEELTTSDPTGKSGKERTYQVSNAPARDKLHPLILNESS